MTIDPKIIDKIQKLLALGSNNDQSAEADAALRKAAQIAEENGLSLSDVSPKGEVSNIGRQGATLTDISKTPWVSKLACCVGDVFDTQPIIDNSNQKIMFVGTKSDLEMTLWYFNLIRIKTLMSAKQFKKERERMSYGEGVVIAIQRRLSEMFTKVREEIRTADTKALVLVKQEEVGKAVETFYPNLQKKKLRNRKVDSSAFHKGFEDGQKIGLIKDRLSA